MLLCLKPCLERDEPRRMCNSRVSFRDDKFSVKSKFNILSEKIFSNDCQTHDFGSVSRSRNLRTAESSASEIFVGLFRLPENLFCCQLWQNPFRINIEKILELLESFGEGSLKLFHLGIRIKNAFQTKSFQFASLLAIRILNSLPIDVNKRENSPSLTGTERCAINMH